MRRRQFVAFLGGAAAWSELPRAQTLDRKVPTIGILLPGPRAPRFPIHFGCVGGCVELLRLPLLSSVLFVLSVVSPALANYCPASGPPICRPTFFTTFRAEQVTPLVAMNRVVYHSSDQVAQAVIGFPTQKMTNLQFRITLSNGTSTFTKFLDPCASSNPSFNPSTFVISTGTGSGVSVPNVPCADLNHADLRIDLPQLSAGRWVLQAAIVDRNQNLFIDTQPLANFTIDSVVESPSNFPSDGVPIELHAQQAVVDATWGISTGIPFPKGALTDFENLVLYESSGDGSPPRAVPAQFTTRATWDVDGGIKWLGLDFLGRYDGTTPRRYLLKTQQSPPNAPALVRVNQDSNFIFVDTGAVKFRVNRKKFAGIDQAWFDGNGAGSYADSNQMVNGPGGPFLVNDIGGTDVIYKAMLDTTAAVQVEEQGPVRATIVANGWYVRALPQSVVRSCPDPDGNCLCKFVVRISAFAGQPVVRVSYRTILTFNTNDPAVRIKDIGWQIATASQQRAWESGAFGFQGRSHGDTPPLGQVAYVHQDRGDRVRIFEQGALIGTGVHSNGWISSIGSRGRLSLLVRSIYQRFPRELEFSNDPNPNINVDSTGWTPRLALHLWPKHGIDCTQDRTNCPFPDPVINTNAANFYKFRYAHQGHILQLKIPETSPEDYIAGFLGGLGFPNDTDSDGGDGGEVTSARFHTNGQGLALGADFALLFQRSDTPFTSTDAEAALFQEDPHAIAEPQWNVSTNVLGPLGARDISFDSVGERALQIAMPGYQSAIADAIIPGQMPTDAGDEFGMWIYGNNHDNWDPSAGAALAHRVWSNSHYQNIWTDWLLYFRSGDKEALKWARAASEEWENVGTVNYGDGTILGRFAGYMYHGKGIVPWGGNSGMDQHWINPSAYLVRYFLTGDRYALDLATTWEAALNASSTPASTNYSPCLGIYPGTTNVETLPWVDSFLRERTAYLGELIDYYTATWSPQALLRIPAAATWINVPLECTSLNGPVWGEQWFFRYYDLSRDPNVVSRLKCWYDSSSPGCSNYSGALDANVLLRTQNSIQSPTIWVCTEPASGNPCAPPAPIFLDSDLTQPLPNPFVGDGNGRFSFYSNPQSRYRLQISVNGSAVTDIFNVKDPGKGSGGIQNSDYNVDAFLFQTTGDRSFLMRDMGTFYDMERIYYDNPYERYHGYGRWVAAENTIWLQQAPYYIKALKDAGIAGPQRESSGVPPVRVVYPSRTETSDQGGVISPPLATCPRGWSNSSTIALALAAPNPTINVTLTPGSGLRDQDRISYFLFPPPSPPVSSCTDGITQLPPPGFPIGLIPNAVKTSTTATCPSTSCTASGLYRFETRSKAVFFYAPYTNLPEALIWGVTDRVPPFRPADGVPDFIAYGRQLYYVRVSSSDGQPLKLRIHAESQSPVSWTATPAWYRIEDALGNVVPNGEGRLFYFVGNLGEQSRDICLPPPPPGVDPVYRLYTSSIYGPGIELLSGANELLLSTSLNDLNAIYNSLPHDNLALVACPP
jgi:hypothetical protein